jgi:hypothetical protein
VIWQSILQEASAAASTANLTSREVSHGWIPTHLSKFEVIAAFASIIGLPLALIGLFLTWREARKAKDASTKAKDAVTKFRGDLSKIDVIAELHRFCDGIPDVKKFLRADLLAIAADRLSELRRLLISCRSAPMFSSEANQTTFQKAIGFLSTSENSIERNLAECNNSLDLVKIAKELSTITDQIQALLIQARTTIGTND